MSDELRRGLFARFNRMGAYATVMLASLDASRPASRILIKYCCEIRAQLEFRWCKAEVTSKWFAWIARHRKQYCKIARPDRAGPVLEAKREWASPHAGIG
jgi:hypothetical protein